MSNPKNLNHYFFHAQLTNKLLQLAFLCDDFAQLRVLSEIADLFYSNTDKQYSDLYQKFEAAAQSLQAKTLFGSEVKENDL